jgi:hypothetical protein
VLAGGLMLVGLVTCGPCQPCAVSTARGSTSGGCPAAADTQHTTRLDLVAWCLGASCSAPIQSHSPSRRAASERAPVSEHVCGSRTVGARAGAFVPTRRPPRLKSGRVQHQPLWGEPTRLLNAPTCSWAERWSSFADSMTPSSGFCGSSRMPVAAISVARATVAQARAEFESAPRRRCTTSEGPMRQSPRFRMKDGPDHRSSRAMLRNVAAKHRVSAASRKPWRWLSINSSSCQKQSRAAAAELHRLAQHHLVAAGAAETERQVARGHVR